MVDRGGQAGAGAFLSEERCLAFAETIVIGSGDERRKRLDDFADALRLINQRWDHRFIPERESLREAYLQRRFKIALHFRMTAAAQERHWLAQIESAVLEGDDGAAGADHQVTYQGDMLRQNKLVVLVGDVQLAEPVQVACPSLVRLYLIDDVPLRTGEGALYRVEFGPVRYKIFPFFVEGEKQVASGPAAIAPALGSQVIERGAQVVDGVSDNEREIIWRALSGDELDVTSRPIVVSLGVHTVKATLSKSLHRSLDLIDVAIGPLNL